MKVVPKKNYNNVEVTKKKKRRWYNDVNEQEQEFRAVKRLYKQKDMNKRYLENTFLINFSMRNFENIYTHYFLKAET
jgi:aminoglycoside N3'-acetyltransferase